MLHAASSDSAQAAATVPLSRHVARFLPLTQAQATSPGRRTKTSSPTFSVDPTRGTASQHRLPTRTCTDATLTL
eukprot:scaffold40798_cov63-Phaeocystis_antarctica.AAC.5